MSFCNLDEEKNEELFLFILFLKLDFYCIFFKHLRYHSPLLVKVKNKMSRQCTKDGAVVTLALFPTSPQESGVVLFISSVLVSYQQLLLLLCVSCRLCVLI